MPLFRNNRLYAVLCLITGMMSIQSGAAMAKQLFPVIGAQGMTALRLLFASIILTLIWQPWKHLPSRKDWPALIFYGLSLGCMNMLFYLAIARIPLGIAIALEFTGPLAIALFSSRRPKDFVWLASAAAGLILLLPINRFSANTDPIGIAYALGAGICWALYIVFGKKASNTIHGGTAAALGMCVGALLVFPIGLAQAGTEILNLSVLPAAFAVAIFSSALPYSLEMVGLSSLPTRTFSILMSLEPVIGIFAGLIFLGEHLNIMQWIAIGLVIIASIGSTWSKDAIESSTEMTP